MNKILATIVCLAFAAFMWWIISIDQRFERDCFDIGGLPARISGDKYCVPNDTELLMKF